VEPDFQEVLDAADDGLAVLVVEDSVEFHESLASWPLDWREAWGHLINLAEDLSKAEGMPTTGLDLAVFAWLDRFRKAGVSATAALAKTWDFWGLPGSPPRVESEARGPFARTVEGFDNTAALDAILNWPLDDRGSWAAMIEDGRRHNEALTATCADWSPPGDPPRVGVGDSSHSDRPTKPQPSQMLIF
jgi:hypothetical protein